MQYCCRVTIICARQTYASVDMAAEGAAMITISTGVPGDARYLLGVSYPSSECHHCTGAVMFAPV